MKFQSVLKKIYSKFRIKIKNAAYNIQEINYFQVRIKQIKTQNGVY